MPQKGTQIEDDRQYWLDCLAEFEEALAEEKNMVNVAPAGTNDSMMKILQFEIEECLKQLT
jgi:hypothetical protein|tara:strand:+ start:627 stop:809 length:183 start_codon:yes stop_codon:yes gene_type:complete